MQFTAPGGAVLWEFGSGQDQIGFGKQILEGGEFFPVRHGFTIKLASAESNRSLFFRQRTFQTLPNPGVAFPRAAFQCYSSYPYRGCRHS